MERIVRSVHSDILGGSPAPDAILKQIHTTEAELRRIETFKPKPLDLACYSVSKALAKQVGDTIEAAAKGHREVTDTLARQNSAWQAVIQQSLSFAGNLEVISPTMAVAST